MLSPCPRKKLTPPSRSSAFFTSLFMTKLLEEGEYEYVPLLLLLLPLRLRPCALLLLCCCYHHDHS